MVGLPHSAALGHCSHSQPRMAGRDKGCVLCKGVLSWDGAQPFAGSGWLLKDDQPAAAVSCYDTEETFVCHLYIYIHICLVVSCISSCNRSKRAAE